MEPLTHFNEMILQLNAMDKYDLSSIAPTPVPPPAVFVIALVGNNEGVRV